MDEPKQAIKDVHILNSDFVFYVDLTNNYFADIFS